MWRCHPRGAWQEVHSKGIHASLPGPFPCPSRSLLFCDFSSSSLPRPSIPAPLTRSPNDPASYFRGTETIHRFSRDCRHSPPAPGPLLLPPPASEMPSLALGTRSHLLPLGTIPPAAFLPQPPHPLSVPHHQISPPCWIILIQIQTRHHCFCLYKASDCTSRHFSVPFMTKFDEELSAGCICFFSSQSPRTYSKQASFLLFH